MKPLFTVLAKRILSRSKRQLRELPEIFEKKLTPSAVDVREAVPGEFSPFASGGFMNNLSRQ